MSEEANRAVELRDYLDIIWRRKWVVVVALLVVAGAGVFRSVRQDRVYQAVGQILLTDGGGDESAIDTQIRILGSQPVRERVRKELPSAGVARGNRVDRSSIASVVVESRDPRQAAAAVNAYIAAYIEYRREQQVEQLLQSTEATRKKASELATQVDALTAEFEGKSAEIDRRAIPVAGEGITAARLREAEVARDRRELDIGLKSRRDSILRDQLLLESKLRDLNSQSDLARPAAEIVNPPSVPAGPIRPTPVSDGIAAAAAGLLLGIALAFLFEYLDDSIKTKEDVQRAMGAAVPVVATIPSVVEWRDRSKPEVVSLTAPRSSAAEAYRSLRTSVQFASIEDPLKVLAITSPIAGEGKTTALANLAVVVAGAGRRVVMLDCDLRRPRIHHFFGLSNEVGFTSWIIGDAPLSAALQEVPGIRRLSLMASGPIPPNPSELLSSRRFPELVKTLQADGALVLVDTPPLLPVTDAAVIARSIDGIFLITMAGRGTRKHLRHAMDVLQQVDAPLAGVVLNRVEPDRGGGYYQGSYYAEPAPPAERRRFGGRGDQDANLVRSDSGRVGTGDEARNRPR